VNLSAAALVLLTQCAPNVGLATMGGLVQYESGWQVYAIGDNSERRSYLPSSYRAAVAKADVLVKRGHSIDAGLAQINSANWNAYGLTSGTVFSPCLNLHAGSLILLQAYEDALRTFPPGDEALAHALSAYNSGGYYAAMGYAGNVIAAARRITFSFVRGSAR